jgi:hypothetical protein
MLIDSLNREAELEEVTEALLVSSSDDFNALAAAELRGDLGPRHLYRVAPEPDEPDLVSPATEVGILGGSSLTSPNSRGGSHKASTSSAQPLSGQAHPGVARTARCCSSFPVS